MDEGAVRDVAIIGAGFAGLGAAIKLRERGVSDVVILERAEGLGGTWRFNTYPGCRCDVASNLYSYSFAPNPEWTNSFSYQPEILSYLQRVAADYDLEPLINYGVTVEDVSFDDARRAWRLATSDGDVVARTVVVATGGLAEPRRPDIAGLDDFAGPILHTGQWDDAVELAGRRVAVIGTGASAIQTVPAIVDDVEHLTVFQRTPSWILPHQGVPTSEAQRATYRRSPWRQRVDRLKNYWQRELLVLGFVKDPRRMARAEKMALDHLASQVADPELRAKLTPDYRIGCKRILLSNDYYPALTRDHVDLVTDGIERVVPGGIVTRGGQRVDADVIILATGFYVTDNPMARRVHGVTGATLADALEGDLAHYRGTSFPGFPNLYMLAGPNTSLGHSSVVFMAEAQLQYAVPAIALALEERALIEPTAEAAARWTDAIRAKLPSTVWGTGCASWYLNSSGVNTVLWPDFTFVFRRATRHFVAADHRFFRAS